MKLVNIQQLICQLKLINIKQNKLPKINNCMDNKQISSTQHNNNVDFGSSKNLSNQSIRNGSNQCIRQNVNKNENQYKRFPTLSSLKYENGLKAIPQTISQQYLDKQIQNNSGKEKSTQNLTSPQPGKQPEIKAFTAICRLCNNDSTPIQRQRTGCAVWGWCFCLFISLPICCWVPFAFDCCYDTEYICEYCRGIRGVVKSRFGC